MKFELLIIACTAFLAFNTYYDGYYLKMLMSWKKYYLIASYVFLGLCAYLFIKKNPSETHTMFAHANNIIKSMNRPIPTVAAMGNPRSATNVQKLIMCVFNL